MGMFDYYEPDPARACPVCGNESLEWQGKDGPCALLIWKQGNKSCVGQRVPDETYGDPAVLSQLRLPPEFEIYAECCGEGLFVRARCTAPKGRWLTTELETSETAQQHSGERREEFARRLAWLRGRAV